MKCDHCGKEIENYLAHPVTVTATERGIPDYDTRGSLMYLDEHLRIFALCDDCYKKANDFFHLDGTIERLV